jgi:hypothetical protein
MRPELAASVAISAVLLASAPAALADGEKEVLFQTPSRNIRCDIWAQVSAPDPTGADNTVLCALMSSITPNSYPSRTPNVYTLSANGRVDVSRVRFVGGPFRSLSYGRQLRLGFLACVSRRAGLRCASRRSGHGFFLSRQSQQVW